MKNEVKIYPVYWDYEYKKLVRADSLVTIVRLLKQRNTEKTFNDIKNKSVIMKLLDFEAV